MKMLYHSLDLKFPPSDPRAKDARVIGEKMEQLNRTVERILDLARSTEPDFTPVNLNALIDELGLLVRHKLENQGIRWTPKLDPALPTIMGRSRQLEQAFLNLILNAAEAMPAGGVLTITSRPLALPPENPHPTHVAVEFKDTGQGMSAELRRRRPASVLRTTKPKGTGLGLAIVDRVVEAHGGQIKIKSRPGQGTTVTITLPIQT
jgi:signal transduction histidine kinase